MAVAVVLQFAFATLLPPLAAAAFYLLQRNTKFGKLSYMRQQLVLGLVFGAIAIFGTEFGIDTADANMNVRDAAPLVGGLMFGGPAGVIAGVIGGVERWFAALWGRGLFSRVGCTLGTIAAGIFAAILRKYMFDNKKPSILMGFSIGVVVEVLHLTFIFFTNMGEVGRAYAVVRACAVPMIACNAISVALAVLVVKLLAKESLVSDVEHRGIAQSMQTTMFVAVLLAFVGTMAFTFALQTGSMNGQTHSLLTVHVTDVQDDIMDASDEKLLEKAHLVADRVDTVEHAMDMQLSSVAKSCGVSEVSVVNEDGIIVRSSYKEFVGFDMSSGEQSSEFLQLLDGTKSELVQEYQRIVYDPTGFRKYAGVAIPGGFVQVGYDATGFQADIASKVNGITRNRHVGQNGSILVVNAEGTIVSSRTNVTGSTLEAVGLGPAISAAQPGELFDGIFEGEKVVGLYIESEGYRIVAVQPTFEAHFARNVSVLITAFMEVIIYGALFAVIYAIIKRQVLDNILKVNATLGLITAGNLDTMVNVRTNEEFASLSDDINFTVDALKRAIGEAAARIDAELEYARTIQRSALPMVFPPYPSHTDFQVYASMDAAKEVGGDFYDFYLLDDDHLVFLIADVSGKGIPGAMFMMRAKTLLKSLAESGAPVEDVFTRANSSLCEGNEAEMFVTCWMGVLDLASGRVTFANAGHNPPVQQHAGGAYEYQPSRPNLVLAGMDGITYRPHELVMEPGDTLFLYTDGVTEATDAHDELFGEQRLLASLNASANQTVEDICKRVHADIDAFVGDAPQFDDITVVALRYVGRGQSYGA